MNPGDEDVVYAALHGHGVYKSMDGGRTWLDISGEGSGLPQSPHVGFNNLIVDPSGSGAIYLIGGCDVDIDLNHTGAGQDEMNTVYKSTDGGATWKNLNNDDLGEISSSIKGLVIAPDNPNTLFIGALNGVFHSTDGGASWLNISDSLGYSHTSGVVLSSDGNTIYAPTLGGGVYAGNVNANVYDVSWDEKSNLTTVIHNIQVAVDPSNTQILYASSYPGGLFKSSNGGTTWTECNFGMASFEIDDPGRQGYYALAVSPSSPQVLYLGLYGVGIYKSTDGASTWRPVNGSTHTMRGMPITSLRISPDDANVVYVATVDGIYRTTDGGGRWENFNRGLDCAGARVLSAGSDGEMYVGTAGAGLYKYEDFTSSWEQMNALGGFGSSWPIWDSHLYQLTSLLFHPANPDVIYLGTFPAGVYKSMDGGQTWRESNIGWQNNGCISLTAHPENPDVIYAGTYDGIYRSTDAGAHWTPWNQGWPEEQWVFSIDFDPRDANVMYACSKNGENKGKGREGHHGEVMKSTDGGAHWSSITAGVNVDQEFNKIIVDRRDPDTLYLASQSNGVLISRHGGAFWTPWNQGNDAPGAWGSNAIPMSISADGLYLYLGTSGAGVYRRPTVTNTSPKAAFNFDEFDFGNAVASDESTVQTFTITNMGARDLSVEEISITGEHESEFIIINNICTGKTMAPLENCTVDVMFSPLSGGMKNAILSIISNDPDDPESNIALTGAVVNFTASPINHDFQTVLIGNTSSPQRFTITNGGLENIEIGSLSIEGENASEFIMLDDACTDFTMSPSDNCTVEILFSPTSVETKRATLYIPSDDPATPVLEIELQGAGAVVPDADSGELHEPYANVCGIENIFEDFENGPPDNWSYEPTSWEIINEGGSLVWSNVQTSLAMIGSNEWDDFIIEASVRVIQSNPIIIFRYNQNGAYALAIENEKIGLWTEREGSIRELTGAHIPIGTSWHTYRIEVIGQQIDIRVDDSPVLSYTDYGSTLISGEIGLKAYGKNGARFDNIRICETAPSPYSWERTNGPMGGPMSSIVIHPDNGDVLYACGAGGGVYKSVDGGENWSIHNIDGIPFNDHLKRLIIDPESPNVLYIASNNGIYKTVDSGASWQNKSNGIEPCHFNISHLVLDPTDSRTLIAGTHTHCWGDSSGSIYKSSDGGESWIDIGITLGFPPDGSVTALSVYGSHIYAGVYDQTNWEDGKLFHSGDGGDTWTEVDFNQTPETTIYSIYMNPNNGDEVWIGLSSTRNIPISPLLFNTLNGGNTWQEVNAFPGFETCNVFGKSPTGDLYVSNFRTSDFGENWENYFDASQTAISGSPGSIAFDPHDYNKMYTALNCGSGLAKSTDGGNSWRRINNSMANSSVPLIANHPIASNIFYAVSSSGGGVFKTTDSGSTWGLLEADGKINSYPDEFRINPNNPENVWHVSELGVVFETGDGGITWENIIDPHGAGFRFESIYAMAVAPSDPDTIYALKNG
ncbi:MAG: choice-of-anchor D domain-containing protein, partial [Planctomycetes bacterium]|nr:choice-of-anchor D domain-containing protein [Planctomycetota bacterium]